MKDSKVPTLSEAIALLPHFLQPRAEVSDADSRRTDSREIQDTEDRYSISLYHKMPPYLLERRQTRSYCRLTSPLERDLGFVPSSAMSGPRERHLPTVPFGSV